jgi:hypothetical protein
MTIIPGAACLKNQRLGVQLNGRTLANHVLRPWGVSPARQMKKKAHWRWVFPSYRSKLTPENSLKTWNPTKIGMFPILQIQESGKLKYLLEPQIKCSPHHSCSP